MPLSALLCLSIASLMLTQARDNESLYTSGMSLMSLPLLLALSGREATRILELTESLPEADMVLVSVACAAIVLGVYLPRAGSIEKLLNPALAALWLLVIVIALSFDQGNQTAQITSVAMFVVGSLWLVARGELRAELKSAAMRDTRFEMASKAVEDEAMFEGGGEVSMYDARRAAMEAERRKRRDKTATDDLRELYTLSLIHI